MRPCVFAAVAVATALAACASMQPQGVAPTFPIAMAATDPARAAIESDITAGRARVEQFFGASFPEPVNVTVAENRTALDAALPASLGIGATQCWMVGVGIADHLYLLSPTAWSDHAQVCDHAGSADEVQGIITHELTHAFHGQHNATRDFTGMDDLGWFVEGLAVLVSGQLDGPRAHDAAAAIAANAAPTSLANAWSGRYRYGVSGSMVQYVDQHYGRATIVALLAATTQQQALDRLGVSEAQFLSDWRAWVQARG